MGERGRQSLKKNNPKEYADTLTRFAMEAFHSSPSVSALALARRVGSDLREWLPATASPYLLDRACNEIYTIFEGRWRAGKIPGGP
jgi:hypothetical protein